MLTRFFRILMVQFLWVLSFAFVASVSCGNFRDVPAWSKSVFLACFAYSAFMLLVVKETPEGDVIVGKVKALAIGSIAVGFLIDMTVRYFINGSA